MTIPTADARPAGFQLRWPPAGGVTVTVRAPEDALDGTDLTMWVQSKSLAVPDADEAILTATMGTVTQVTEDGTTFDTITATFDDLDLLEQGVWYRLYLADGATVWANGLVMGDNAGAESQSTTLAVSVAAVDLNLDLTVLSGVGGGGAPSGGAGGFLSGTYPNPGVNVEALQDLVGAMAGEGLTYDDVAGELRVTVEGGGGVQTLGVLHLTAIDIDAPHPLGGFLPPNTRLIELVGQTNPAQNGTYRTPADPETQPLVRDDDQLLQMVNRGQVVTFSLVVAGGSFTSGSYHFQVFVEGITPLLTVRHGVQWFAQWRYEGDPTEPVTIVGASFGHQVLVSDDPDDSEFDASTDGGLYVYQGAGQVMARSGVVARVGSMVYVMTEDTRWTLTPHAGWVPANIVIGAQIDALDERVDALEADTSAFDLARGTAEAVALLADHSARVEFPGTAATSGGAITTPSLGDVFTDGYEVRIVGRPDFRTSGSLYWEGGGQSNDGVGGLDNHEPAFHRGDPDFPELFDVNALYLFFEAILDGDTEEIVGRLRGKLSTTWGQWCEVMVRADFDTGIVTGWERVTYERDDGSTYVTSSVDGAVFRLVGVADDQTYTSINSSAFDWWIGHDFGGGWRRTVWRNGADGDLIDDVRATDITPGDTTFTSTGGNVWTVGAGVTVVRDAEDRLDDLENAPSGSGDVTGPASSVDSRAALFDGTTGKLLKQASAAPVLEGDQRLAPVYAKAPAATAAAYSNLGTFGTASTTHGLTAVNRRIWVPIYVLADTYTRIGVNVTTGAVSTWRLGLHADDGGFPAAAPLADYGTIDMSGSSGRRDITISQALASGWYWAQIQVDSFTATPTVTAVVGQSAQPPMPLGFPTDRANPTRGRASVRDTGGTGGTLGNAPADLSVSGVSLENDAPRVWLWKA